MNIQVSDLKPGRRYWEYLGYGNEAEFEPLEHPHRTLYPNLGWECRARFHSGICMLFVSDRAGAYGPRFSSEPMYSGGTKLMLPDEEPDMLAAGGSVVA